MPDDNFGFPKPADDIYVEPKVEIKQLQIQAETLKNFAHDVRLSNWKDQATANAIADEADRMANQMLKTGNANG